MTGGETRRVVVLVKRFPRLSETFILNEFLELRRQGLRIELWAIMDPEEPHSHPEALALVPEVVYLQTGRLLSAWRAIARAIRRHPRGVGRAIGWTVTRHTRAAARNCIHALVLVDLLDRGAPAHLHAQFLHSPGAIAFIARKVSGQRYSLSGHAKDIYTTLPENLRLRCGDAEFVTTCTEANRRHLVEDVGVPSAKVHLCRHGVDAGRFARTRPARTPGRIVSVGRLVPKKGFDVLIRACGLLSQRGVRFELRIVGGGELRGELQALAAEEGIAELVHFTGSVSSARVAEELAAAEVFALSPAVMADGDRDGIPNVLLEAMAAALPVVATRVSGIPEVLTDGVNGRLVAPDRPEQLCEVLAELLADEEQRARLGSAGANFVREECAWSEVVVPLRALLEGAAAEIPEPEGAPEPAGAFA